MTNSPPPPPPGVPGYPSGPAPYGNPYAAAPVDAPYGVATLVLSIVGFFGLAICWPIAMILGFKGRAQVSQAPPGTYKTGMLTTGWVLSIVGTVLWVLGIIAIVILASTGAFSEGSSIAGAVLGTATFRL